MAVFYSFHYERDNWRVQQVRNIGSIDNADSVGAQEWEKVRYQSDESIMRWIDSQMSYKRAVVVLIGQETASRKWVQYEIQRAYELKKPLLGIRIHGLKDRNGNTSLSGKNPFDELGYFLVPVFDPAGYNSQSKFNDIRNNLSLWITRGYKRP